jgi:DNA-binding GntR family transcriptional regulator
MDLRIAPKLIQHQTVERLRAAIMSGVFKPGQRLIESELSQQMGVSRPSLREALRSLEGEKLIQMVPNKGPIVPYMPWEEAKQIYEVRTLIEGHVAARCAEKATPAVVEELKEALKGFAGADKQGDSAGRLHWTKCFFEVIFRTSGNVVLEEVAQGLLARINALREQSMSRPGRGKLSLSEMKAIMVAIEKRDPAAAAQAAIHHIARACEAAHAVAQAKAPSIK